MVMNNRNHKQNKQEKSGPYDRFVTGLDKVCERVKKINSKVLRAVMDLTIKISREGREGRKIGTIFVINDEEAVLKSFKTLILDPLKGHSKNLKSIYDPNMRETLKELARLDGAFVISDSGIVISATRYLDADSKDIDLPLGLGSRHVSAASVSKHTQAMTVVVSESSIVRVLNEWEIIAEIIPELWFIQQITNPRNDKRGN
jgi:DNA integrity scanning protein DisA with diadenylate cyclase activity